MIGIFDSLFSSLAKLISLADYWNNQSLVAGTKMYLFIIRKQLVNLNPHPFHRWWKGPLQLVATVVSRVVNLYYNYIDKPIWSNVWRYWPRTIILYHMGFPHQHICLMYNSLYPHCHMHGVSRLQSLTHIRTPCVRLEIPCQLEIR